MKILENNTIKLDKEFNELDRFVLKFVNILKKFTNYVIVSGYVSILFGRSRSTEDVDILVPKLNKNKFEQMYKTLIEKGFYCINVEATEEVYSYLTEGNSVRFAEKNAGPIPNIEFKFVKTKVDEITIKESIKVLLKKEELRIAPIEMQIIFKEIVLKSPKDMEDALHLREIFRLDKNKLEKYRVLVEKYGI